MRSKLVRMASRCLKLFKTAVKKPILYTNKLNPLIILSYRKFSGSQPGFFIDPVANKKEKGYASTLAGREMNYNNLFEKKLYKIAQENLMKYNASEQESGTIYHPIPINTVDDEEFYLNARYGTKKWNKVNRELLTKDGIRILKYTAKVNGDNVDVYFDISNFPGKWAI